MIDRRRLGRNGPLVGAIGYGAMGLEGYYGKADDISAVAAVEAAIDLGCSLIDTADAYGNGHNEVLVGRGVKNRRDDAVVATKFGIVFDADETGTEIPTGWGFSLVVNGTPAYVRRSLDNSLSRLGISHIDLWYLHFPDPATPIEETVGAMAEGVRQGKVRHLGLSNVRAEQIRRASAVHPIAAVQFEYSLWRREAEVELLPALRELGIALVPWSPLGAGFFAGTLGDLPAEDFRNNNPRFQGDNLAVNQDRFAPLLDISASLGITPAQLALAWLLHQGGDIVPIPGTRRADRIKENASAARVSLGKQILKRISGIARPGLARGETLL